MAIKSGSIEGLDELIKDFLKFGDKAMEQLKGATNYSTMILYHAAKDKINSRSGNLARALHIIPARISKSTKSIVSGRVELSTASKNKEAAEYGAYVELGHKIMKTKGVYDKGVMVGGKWLGHVEARPFMRPASDENKEIVANIFIKAMDRIIKELGDK